jgi:hypothetical protein
MRLSKELSRADLAATSDLSEDCEARKELARAEAERLGRLSQLCGCFFRLARLACA